MEVKAKRDTPNISTRNQNRALKVKVKWSLCLTKHRDMKTYWGSGGVALRIFTLELDESEWSAPHPARFP
jgi:hypothetical protein